MKALHEITQLRLRFDRVQLVDDLERNGHHRSRVVGQRRFRHQDEELAFLQSAGDLVRGLLSREFPKNSSMRWISSAPRSRGACLMRYSKESPSPFMLEHFQTASRALWRTPRSGAEACVLLRSSGRGDPWQER